MAREGAMLGVPSVYLGFRDMPANEILINEKMLLKIDPMRFSDFCKVFNENKIFFPKQVVFREYLDQKWEDVTNFVIKKIEEYK